MYGHPSDRNPNIIDNHWFIHMETDWGTPEELLGHVEINIILWYELQMVSNTMLHRPPTKGIPKQSDGFVWK